MFIPQSRIVNDYKFVTVVFFAQSFFKYYFGRYNIALFSIFGLGEGEDPVFYLYIYIYINAKGQHKISKTTQTMKLQFDRYLGYRQETSAKKRFLMIQSLKGSNGVKGMKIEIAGTASGLL